MSMVRRVVLNRTKCLEGEWTDNVSLPFVMREK